MKTLLQGINKKNLFSKNTPNRKMFENFIKYFFNGRKYSFKKDKKSYFYYLTSGDDEVEFQLHNMHFSNKEKYADPSYMVRSVVIFSKDKRTKSFYFYFESKFICDKCVILTSNSKVEYTFCEDICNCDITNLDYQSHCISGPAIFSYKDNSIINKYYYYKDKQIFIPEEFEINPEIYLQNHTDK